MKKIRQQIDDLRAKYDLLREDRLPIDVFTFLEVDLGLDALLFDGLVARFEMEAAIKWDFSGIYFDQAQYLAMEKSKQATYCRFRFSAAHELGHYFLHRHLPQREPDCSIPDFAVWPNSYTIEKAANEFAGSLLVPSNRLFDMFNELKNQDEENLLSNTVMRDLFCKAIAPKFGVNPQVVAVRLDIEGIWPAA